MKAQFPGKCFGGKDPITPGDEITKDTFGWSHPAHKRAQRTGPLRSNEFIDWKFDGRAARTKARGQLAWGVANARGADWTSQDEQDYQQGLADGRRYQMEKQAYGKELADAFQAQDEFNRYWKYGED